MRKILVIAEREFADNIRSRRLIVITAIMFLYFLSMYFFVWRNISENLLASLMTSLVSSLQFIASILGLAIGYDVIAGDREKGILKLVLSRPVYREDIINGKALGAIATIALTLFSAFYLMLGIAISLTGLVIGLQDFIRATISIFFVILYSIVYYSISQFFSVISEKSSKSLILSIAAWLFFAIILPIIAVFVSFMLLGPIPTGGEGTTEYFKKMQEINNMITSITPERHVGAILNSLNSVYIAKMLTSTTSGVSVEIQTPENQTEVVSTILSEMKIYPNILDALSASLVNIAALIFYIIIPYIASYVAFVARKVEK